MKTYRTALIIIASLCLIVPALSGCGPKIITVPLRDNIKFAERTPKIALPIGLYVSPEAREYVIKYQLAGPLGKVNEFRHMPIGRALMPNGQRSLSKVFQTVQIMDSPEKAPPYYVELKADPASSLEMGRWKFSEKSVDLHLVCMVKRSNGALIWKKTINSKSAKSNPQGWLAGVAMHHAIKASNTKLKAAGEESLYLCLESLNAELIKNKASIFR